MHAIFESISFILSQNIIFKVKLFYLLILRTPAKQKLHKLFSIDIKWLLQLEHSESSDSSSSVTSKHLIKIHSSNLLLHFLKFLISLGLFMIYKKGINSHHTLIYQIKCPEYPFKILCFVLNLVQHQLH